MIKQEEKVGLFLLFVLFSFTVISSTADPLPNSVRTCGTSKLKISETILEGSAVDDYQLFFVSNNNQIVFIRTMNGQIYRSSDEGFTWVKQTVPQIMPKIDVSPNGISRIFNSQLTDGTIALYFLGANHQSLWVSKNGGNNYTYHEGMPSGIDNFLMHPLYAGTVLGRRVVSDKTELWLGTDFGATWTRLLSSPSLHYYIPVSAPVFWSIFPSTDPKRIYTMTSDATIIYSDDYFQTTFTIDLRGVVQFSIYAPEKFVVKTCASKICAEKELYISDDAGKTFNLAKIPERTGETMKEQDYYVWEISDNAIWVFVERACSARLCWGDLYHSNAADKDFTLSLPFMKKWEFTKYNSVEGIYLANQLLNQSHPHMSDEVRSLITFNKGSDWTILQPPQLNANGQPSQCSIADGCSLHVHGWGSGHTFTYFYSIPPAVGLMIASGNMGTRLEEREDRVATYVSFNGGVKWQEVRKTDYVPEIGDSGAVIVLVKEFGETNELVYTINNGDEWNSCQFSDTLVDISNIRVSIGWNSRRFVMYGLRRNATGSFETVVYQLNFDDELTKQCTTNDFTTWSPKDEHGNCVLGKATYYTVRNTTCYYGVDYKPSTSSNPCPCTDEDYECDHCFYRADLSSPCSLECDVPNLPPPPAACKTYYEVEVGYRKVDGDVCLPAGTKPPKAQIPCPSTHFDEVTKGLGAVAIIIIVVVVLLSLVGIVAYLYRYNESFHNCVTYEFGIESSITFTRTEQQGHSLVLEDDLE